MQKNVNGNNGEQVVREGREAGRGTKTSQRVEESLGWFKGSHGFAWLCLACLAWMMTGRSTWRRSFPLRFGWPGEPGYFDWSMLLLAMQ